MHWGRCWKICERDAEIQNNALGNEWANRFIYYVGRVLGQEKTCEYPGLFRILGITRQKQPANAQNKPKTEKNWVLRVDFKHPIPAQPGKLSAKNQKYWRDINENEF